VAQLLRIRNFSNRLFVLFSPSSPMVIAGLCQTTAYSGCQKNVPLSKRFFLQPLMPQSFIPEHFYGKGYKMSLPSFSGDRARIFCPAPGFLISLPAT
jgi:hypothetical protein